jgi:hypothetical protein
MTPMVMRFEAETRPVRAAQALPGTSIAAPAPIKKLRRFGRDARLEMGAKLRMFDS